MKMSKSIVYGSLILFFTGCGSTLQPIYKWNNYVNSSASYGMYGEDKEVAQKHETELKKIIDESNEANMRVAPGIYAEYAQLLYQSNKKQDAKKYFLLEKKSYPESTTFIDNLLAKLYPKD